MLVKVGGRTFPAPTQLLPENGSGVDGTAVLDSLTKALAGCIPDPKAKLVTTSECWLHREFRSSTRNLLVGVANALQQVMPPGWKLNQCQPPNLLKPAGCSSREKLIQQEVAILSAGTLNGRTLHFLWSESDATVERSIDFYPNPKSFYRLCFSGDEGTEVPRLTFVYVCFNKSTFSRI